MKSIERGTTPLSCSETLVFSLLLPQRVDLIRPKRRDAECESAWQLQSLCLFHLVYILIIIVLMTLLKGQVGSIPCMGFNRICSCFCLIPICGCKFNSFYEHCTLSWEQPLFSKLFGHSASLSLLSSAFPTWWIDAFRNNVEEMMSSSKTLWDQLLILGGGMQKQHQISKKESSLQTVSDYAKSVAEGEWCFPRLGICLCLICFYLGFASLLKCFF